jgi:hypothetical protein
MLHQIFIYFLYIYSTTLSSLFHLFDKFRINYSCSDGWRKLIKSSAQSVCKNATVARFSRFKGKGEKEGKGFGGEHVFLRHPFEVSGYRRWMIANECLNGKNLLIMAWYNAWFGSLVSPTFPPFTILPLTSDTIFRNFYPLPYECTI